MPRLVERGGGAFVAVSARAALRPFSGAAGYITAKAAVIAFIQALDAEYRKQGVRANAILPSVIDTPANRADQPDADHSNWVAAGRDREGRAPSRLGRRRRDERRRDPGLRSGLGSGSAVPGRPHSRKPDRGGFVGSRVSFHSRARVGIAAALVLVASAVMGTATADAKRALPSLGPRRPHRGHLPGEPQLRQPLGALGGAFEASARPTPLTRGRSSRTEPCSSACLRTT